MTNFIFVPFTTGRSEGHFPILEQSEAAAGKKHHDKQKFMCGVLASVNCNSQCLQGQQHG
jgi:hypothetical protein